MEGVLGGLLLIGFGLFCVIKPDTVWEIRHSLSVQNGEPTDFFLSFTRFWGGCSIIIGLIFILIGIG